MIHFAKNELIYTSAAVSGQAFRKLVLYTNDTPINAAAPLTAYAVAGAYNFDISGVLSQAGLWAVALPTLPTDAVGVSLTDAIKPIVAKTAAVASDSYGGTDTLLVMGGQIREDLFDTYTQATYAAQYLQNRFLSHRQATEAVRPSQRLFVHFLSNWDSLPTGLGLSVAFNTPTLYGEYQPLQALDSVALNKVYQIAFQPATILNAYTGTERPTGFRLGITSGEDVLCEKTFELDYTNTLSELEILYLNYFGLWETLRVTGDFKLDMDFTSDAIIIKNRKQDVNSGYTQTLSIQLGEHNSPNAKDILMDLGHSNDIFWLNANKPIRLTKSFKTTTAYQASARYDNPTLEFGVTYQY